MPVFLIRHAHAGSRSAWDGDDVQRPLSRKGHAQADALAARLRDEPIGTVLSSPIRRCVETAQPIGAALGLPVQVREELAEGADPDVALALLQGVVSTNPAVVGHGDLIPRLVRRLAAQGMRTSADLDACQKGSLWVIELDGALPVRAAYEAPAPVAVA